MTRLSRSFLLGLSFGLLLLGNGASAAVVNGSFESGMASWTTVGPNSVVPSGTINLNVATDGSNYGYIHNGVGAQNVLIQDFVLQSLGVAPNYISSNFSGSTEGALLFQQFTVGAGFNQLTFDWNFLTDENSRSSQFNDFAFAHLFDNTLLPVATAYVDTFAPLVAGSPNYVSETGWQSVTFSGLNSGSNYTLVFGVFDVSDRVVDSALIIDNVRLVPEPSSISLLALCGLAGFTRRRSVRR